jgi:hypothetical protein
VSAPFDQIPTLGVIIVTFNSADVIADCLESLLAARGVRLRILVVDNCSTDDTLARLEAWAAGATPYTAPPDIPFPLAASPKPLRLHAPGEVPESPDSTLTLLKSPVNGGFAAGVNLGLAQLARDPALQRFWILNPDSVVPPETPGRLATALGPEARFALMGGRVNYLDPPERIQIDGGTINRLTGVTGNINLGRPHPETPPPAAASMAFVTGASMVASRAFYERAGPLREDYFLYYEEVDWALRRGDLPLAYCEGALVYHRAGTAIGSPTIERMASAFSLYFKHRARMRFVRRFFPTALPTAYAYSLAKAAQIALKGYRREALALLRAVHGLPPPPAVRARLSPEAARRAFD